MNFLGERENALEGERKEKTRKKEKLPSKEKGLSSGG